MTAYFKIIIPVKQFFSEPENILIHHSVNIYLEKWNDERKFHFERIDINAPNIASFSDKDYRGFFLTTLDIPVEDGKLILEKDKVEQTHGISFYDDKLSDYCIEGKGGREDNENIEIIKLRRISKKQAKEMERFFNALQGRFMKSSGIKQGLKMGQYLYDKVYYPETGKNMLDDFSKREMKYFK